MDWIEVFVLAGLPVVVAECITATARRIRASSASFRTDSAHYVTSFLAGLHLSLLHGDQTVPLSVSGRYDEFSSCHKGAGYRYILQ